LENTGKLSAIDQISSLIRNGEDKETEFKQTFCFDIRKKKRESYITDQIIKTIAAFLNSDGGNLLVGVSDSKKITGLKDEMEKFFKQGSPNPIDNIQKHLKDLIKSRIGEEFYPLIDSNLISIKSDYILRVKCEPSDKEVFVNQKEFYVRTNPATDRLEGQNLSEYIKRRFWENQ
jgi:predicted HTH transcriptional regulator